VRAEIRWNYFPRKQSISRFKHHSSNKGKKHNHISANEATAIPLPEEKPLSLHKQRTIYVFNSSRLHSRINPTKSGTFDYQTEISGSLLSSTEIKTKL
jgi:hypothetical protein